MLKIGDKVTTNYYPKEKNIIRTITFIEKGKCYSGYLASVDGGEKCPCCERDGTIIKDVDSMWFKKVE